MMLANGKLSEERDYYYGEVMRLKQQLAEISSEMMMDSGHKMASGSTMRSTPNGTQQQTPGFYDGQSTPIPPFQAETLVYPSLTP